MTVHRASHWKAFIRSSQNLMLTERYDALSVLRTMTKKEKHFLHKLALWFECSCRKTLIIYLRREQTICNCNQITIKAKLKVENTMTIFFIIDYSLQSLLSPTSFSFSFLYVGMYEQQDTGLTWDNVGVSPVAGDSLNFTICCLMTLLDALIYGLLASAIVYFQQRGMFQLRLLDTS
jgi:hypothetical protein